MAPKTLLVVQRGAEITRVLSPALAEKHLLGGGGGGGVVRPVGSIDNISKLAVIVLDKLETIDNVQYKGIGAALSPLWRRFDKADAKVVKQMRALHEAFGFVRHLTTVGEAAWLQSLEAAVSRLKAKDDNANLVTSTEVVVSSAKGLEEKQEKKTANAQRGAEPPRVAEKK